MPQLFELRRQRAAADHAVVGIHGMQSIIHQRFCETVPLDGRIAVRILRVQHMAVFNKQQRLHHQRRDIRVVPVYARGTVKRIKIIAVPAGNAQPRLGLLAVNGIQAGARK